MLVYYDELIANNFTMSFYPINIGKSKKITIIGGINVLNDIDEAIDIGNKFKEACERKKISYVFKASFKAIEPPIDAPITFRFFVIFKV